MVRNSYLLYFKSMDQSPDLSRMFYLPQYQQKLVIYHLLLKLLLFHQQVSRLFKIKSLLLHYSLPKMYHSRHRYQLYYNLYTYLKGLSLILQVLILILLQLLKINLLMHYSILGHSHLVLIYQLLQYQQITDQQMLLMVFVVIMVQLVQDLMLIVLHIQEKSLHLMLILVSSIIKQDHLQSQPLTDD